MDRKYKIEVILNIMKHIDELSDATIDILYGFLK